MKKYLSLLIITRDISMFIKTELKGAENVQ